MESCMKSDKRDTKNHSNSDSKYFGLTKQTSEVCIVIKITRKPLMATSRDQIIDLKKYPKI